MVRCANLQPEAINRHSTLRRAGPGPPRLDPAGASVRLRVTGITRTDRPCDWPSHCRDCPRLCASGPKSRASGGKVSLSRDEPFAPDEASLNALKFALASNSGGRDRTTECNVLKYQAAQTIAKPIAFGLTNNPTSRIKPCVQNKPPRVALTKSPRAPPHTRIPLALATSHAHGSSRRTCEIRRDRPPRSAAGTRRLSSC